MQYVSMSGGADSTALAIYLHERGEEFEMVFADTGAELPETYWILPRIARQLGRKLHVVSNGTFFQHLAYPRAGLKRLSWMLPGFRVRWCTRELKTNPLNSFVPKGATVYQGICADEAHRAAGFSSGKSGVVYKYPLVDADMDKRDVLRLCSQHNLLNPCYEWRTNCSCFCCPFQRLSDWVNLWKYHPDLYALAEDWESIASTCPEHTQHRWNVGCSLANLRGMEEGQIALLPECREQACVICSV